MFNIEDGGSVIAKALSGFSKLEGQLKRGLELLDKQNDNLKADLDNENARHAQFLENNSFERSEVESTASRARKALSGIRRLLGDE